MASWTESDYQNLMRERGQTAFKEAKRADVPAKGHKFRARACIVTPDLTLFTKQDIHNAATFKRIQLVHTTTPLKELAQACGIVGDWFGSEKEAKRYIQLAGLEKAGAIRHLQTQVPYELLVNGTKIGSWRADFVFEELCDGQWSKVREDSKGVRTPEYKLKKKCAEAQYGWSIRET